MSERVEKFFNELQKLSEEYHIDIYPGFVDRGGCESGIVVYDDQDKEAYSLVECNRHRLRFNKIPEVK